MRREKGFSLVEVVVVLAIMVILSAGIMLIVPQMSGQQLRQGVRAIDTGLANTKTTVMAKGTGFFQLVKDADGGYSAVSPNGTEKSLGSRKTLTVTYTTSDNAVHTITEAEPLIISYDKSSGAFQERIKSLKADGKTVDVYDTGNYVRKITVSLQGQEKAILLYPKTGKHEMQ